MEKKNVLQTWKIMHQKGMPSSGRISLQELQNSRLIQLVNPSSETLTSLSCLLPEVTPLLWGGRGRNLQNPPATDSGWREEDDSGFCLGLELLSHTTNCGKKHSEDITKAYILLRAPDISKYDWKWIFPWEGTKKQNKANVRRKKEHIRTSSTLVYTRFLIRIDC